MLELALLLTQLRVVPCPTWVRHPFTTDSIAGFPRAVKRFLKLIHYRINEKFPRGAPLLPVLGVPGLFLFPSLLPPIIFVVLFHV